MASFLRKNAPAWPPLKDAYSRLDSQDDILLNPGPNSALSTSTVPNTAYSAYFSTPDLAGRKSPPSKPEAQTTDKTWNKEGWRGGARLAFYVALTVLVSNVVLLIVMVSGLFDHMDSMYMIYQGSCPGTEKRNTWVHLVVNLLSTALLSGSNYCMQLLSAPTREDVDKSHAKGHWLDIGIPSIRNLRSLRALKVVLYWTLMLSSIPLHLLYNSVFFSALATNDYHVVYATADFVHGAAYDTQRFPDMANFNITNLQFEAPRYERLNNSECISEYAMDFITNRKDVILVVSNPPSNASSLLNYTTNETPRGHFPDDFNPFSWICNDPLTSSKTNACCENEYGFIPCSSMATKLEDIADTWWRSGGYDIQYCLSAPMEPDCHLHFAAPIAAIVIFFNIIKASIVFYVAFRFQDKPLVTLGDAIESFVVDPDVTTQGMCLATSEMMEKNWARGYAPGALRYDGKRHRWYKAASKRQWITLAVLISLAAIGVILGIIYGISNLNPRTLSNAWSQGLGIVRTQNLIQGLNNSSLGTNGVYISAITANCPQILFSFMYMVYNTVFTSMALGDEWDRFVSKATGAGTRTSTFSRAYTFLDAVGGGGRLLRTSDPKYPQRSTYFLGLPYRYAAVMLSMSGLLHWLCSQSIFLANIAVIPLDGTVPVLDEITTCAYSPRAMISLLILGTGMIMWIGGHAFKRFSGRMAIVGSNSAAISAACHVNISISGALGTSRAERQEMTLKPLRWGVVDFGKGMPGEELRDWDGTASMKSGISSQNGITTGLGLDNLGPPKTGKNSAKIKQGRFEENLNDQDDAIANGLKSGGIGHCSFHTSMVGRPVVGRLYA